MAPHYPTSSRHTRLPSDEYKHLQHLQKRERLTTHFTHQRNRPSTSYNRSNPYRDTGLSKDHRIDISKVRNATRAALGPSFSFDDDDSYPHPTQHRDNYERDNYERSRGWIDDGEYSSAPIPKKNLDEYHQRWQEDDEDYDVDRYQADYAKDAPWRQPAEMNHVPMPIQYSYHVRHEVPVMHRHDSGVAISARAGSVRPATSHHPVLKSKFSFGDDEDEGGVKKKGGLRGLFRRR